MHFNPSVSMHLICSLYNLYNKHTFVVHDWAGDNACTACASWLCVQCHPTGFSMQRACMEGAHDAPQAAWRPPGVAGHPGQVVHWRDWKVPPERLAYMVYTMQDVTPHPASRTHTQILMLLRGLHIWLDHGWLLAWLAWLPNANQPCCSNTHFQPCKQYTGCSVDCWP